VQLTARLARPAVRIWVAAVVLFAFRLAAVVGVALFGARGLGPLSTFGIALRPGDRGLVASFFHWDSVRYLYVAAHGYTHKSLTVYFPLYPLMVRAVHALGPSYAGAALIVAWTAAFGFTAAFVHLVRGCWAERRWLPVVLLALWAPASFFYFSGYPEGTEVLLLTVVLICVQRRRFWLAALAAGVASASSPFGVVFVVPVVVGIVQDGLSRRAARGESADVDPGGDAAAAGPAAPPPASRHWWATTWARAVGAAVVAEFGAIAYCIYLWVRFDAPFEFEQAQAQWNRQLTYPFHGVVWSLDRMLHGQLIGVASLNGNFDATDAINDIVTVAVTLALVWIVVQVGWRNLGRSPLLPGIVLSAFWILFNVSNATAGGLSPEALARHLGVLVPVYMAVAYIRRSELVAGLFAGSVVLGTMAQTLYAHNLWFT
jgi:hypothetical protein